MTGQKTYWHLLHQKRLPTEYELLSSSLHYYMAKGFEVNVPANDWYRKYQQGSPFQCSNWEKFTDPRDTTYTSYTGLQTAKEVFVGGLLETIERTSYDRRLSSEWISTLERVFAPLRYPVHGLQMLAAYIGQMAPSGRITIAALFQAADEMRRVQRIAYRIRQLQLTHPHFGESSKSVWQDDPLWQPLRQAIERLLITYDWGEAFVALNLVLKPSVDELFMIHFGGLARRSGDTRLEEMLLSLNEDCQWHREWSVALVKTALQDRLENRLVIQQWSDKWQPLVLKAIAAFAPIFKPMPEMQAILEVGQIAQITPFYESLANHLGANQERSVP